MSKAFERDRYAFLRKRAEQLLREGNHSAALRLIRMIDGEQAELFRERLRMRTGIAK